MQPHSEDCASARQSANEKGRHPFGGTIRFFARPQIFTKQAENRRKWPCRPSMIGVWQTVFGGSLAADSPNNEINDYHFTKAKLSTCHVSRGELLPERHD